MRIEQMEYFIAVAEEESINKASEKLYISQQSLSTSLKKMEEELETKLIERTPFGIRLTDNGYIALECFKDVIERINRAKLEMGLIQADEPDDITGHLTIFASPVLNGKLFPYVMEEMRNHNKLKVTLLEKENREIINDILEFNNGIYFLSLVDGVETEFDLIDKDKIFFKNIAEFESYACVAENHVLAEQKSVSLRTIAKYPLALYQGHIDLTNYAYDILKKMGKLDIRLTSNNSKIIDQYIISGKAISITGVLFEKSLEKKGIKYIPINNASLNRIVCVARKEYYAENQKSIDLMLSLIGKIFKNN